MSSNRFICILVWLSLALALNVSAQESRKTALTGYVTDQFGSIVPEVRISVQNKEGKTYLATTNDEGKYEVELVSGVYTIVFSRKPFDTVNLAGYLIGMSPMRLDVSLQCSSCEVIEDTFTTTGRCQIKSSRNGERKSDPK